MTATVSAIFVSREGPYWGRPDVDAWDEVRDARLYAGYLPVVAHPPCAAWCRLAGMREYVYGYPRGEDGGCFESALSSVRRCNGVLEHPTWSAAWKAFGLLRPTGNGWSRFLGQGTEWVCEVSQAAYGHRARKLTWLLYVGENAPPAMNWSRPDPTAVVGSCSRRADGSIWRKGVAAKSLGKAEASRTPPLFADALLELARLAGGQKSARPTEETAPQCEQGERVRRVSSFEHRRGSHE
jgi:hypothetical protein